MKFIIKQTKQEIKPKNAFFVFERKNIEWFLRSYSGGVYTGKDVECVPTYNLSNRLYLALILLIANAFALLGIYANLSTDFKFTLVILALKYAFVAIMTTSAFIVFNIYLEKYRANNFNESR